MSKLSKDLNSIIKNDRKIKTYKGEWYTVNSIFGCDWALFYCLLGGREAGKSYSAMKWAVTRKLKLKDKCKFYWFRLTEAQTTKLLTNGADKLIDPDLQRKFNIKLIRKGDSLYTYDEVIKTTKTGKETINKTNLKEFCTVLACSTMHNNKGVAYFDNEFDGEYIIILDEMNREQSEKNSFDIVYAFVNSLENIARSTKKKIKVVMIGNTLEEASDILCAFNFLPPEFGRYKLKKKRCVIDYIKPSEEYLKRRQGTIADIMMPDASTFTNEVKIDRSLLVNKRQCIKPMHIIKFGKTEDKWFTLWNNNIIQKYNNENVPDIGMTRYLDARFSSDLQSQIFEMFDQRIFRFTNLAIFKQFQKEMKLIKKQ